MKKFIKAFLWFLFLILNVAFFWMAVFLIQNRYYELGITFAILIFLIDFFIFNPKGYPYRYIIPALILLFILVLYPIYFTVKTAFTNYGTGHFMPKEEAVERLLYSSKYTYVVESGEKISYKVFVVYDGINPTDDFLILFKIDEKIFVASKPTPVKRKGREILLNEGVLQKIETESFLYQGQSFRIIPWPATFEDIKLLVTVGKSYRLFYTPDDPLLDVNASYFKSRIAQVYLWNSDFVEPSTGKKYTLRILPDGTWGFVQVERLYRLAYEEVYENGRTRLKMVLVNNLTNRKVIEKDGAFYDINEKGEEVFLVGFIDYVGWKNFLRIITDKRVTGPFLSIFAWTFTWAALSVVLSLAVGLPFALVLNDPRLRARNLYRTLLIIPWAIPAFISALVWRNGLLNETYGLFNKFLLPLFKLGPIRWFNDPFWARVGVLLVNIWLTFPYMMTISLGALQSIPHELYEAASIDGAGKFKRFTAITFPLLMTVIGPLLVSSFAFSFNNFTIIFLITAGGPPIPGSVTPTGYTDILMSYVYKLAFQAGTGQDFGFASAISILIFFLVGTISFFNFKFSGAFEEVGR
ncbi:DUF4896 domain-containing protein [Pseudothermotoga thermarum]|uniref:Maltose/maltodextrin transport system permease protein n=1 Tax=Pseudothermotoga thermarum DSM 5069 TaxID=688269 RepID=F7YUQ4_9THEM|nr:DUF4896 domain-containing protein [Pseudothermotoga thermarum]AEH50239.1 mannooligosaccharide ABC transporter membrane protein; maltose ABC transporter membrane protein [Pseudothermotoga thermarum DSM 5069]